MNSNLSKTQMADLRNSLKSSTLEKAVEVVCTSGACPRPLYGQNSVMLRALGDNFNPADYQRTYFDKFRGKEAMTEFAEFREALTNYDSSQSEQNTLDLFLEAGDVLFQSKVVDLRHKENPKYPLAKSQIGSAITFVQDELERRGLSFDRVQALARIKYGILSWNINNGLPPKNKTLVEQLCLEALRKT